MKPFSKTKTNKDLAKLLQIGINAREKNPSIDKAFKSLSKKYPTPSAVQKYLRTFKYNDEKSGPELKSAAACLKKKTLHCIEGALLAAAILEHQGYPPLILSLESIDHTDHVLYLFREKGKWGSIGYSKFEGLYGRRPAFRSIRDLVWSYFDVYICLTGKISAYEIVHLDESATDWRYSKDSVWELEQFLIKYKHRPLISSMKRYLREKEKFENGTQQEHPPHAW